MFTRQDCDHETDLRERLAQVLESSRDGVKPTIPDVRPLVSAYRGIPGNEAGGSLHIVLDDGNIRDADVADCQRWAREAGDDLGAMLAEILAAMSRTQRAKLSRT